MKKMAMTTLGVLGAVTFLGSPLYGQSKHPPLKVAEESPGLLAQAKISGDSALRLAQARVPGGHVVKAEIEKEDGALVYSFDLRVPQKSGIEEVLVNATTGAIVSVEHESARAEAREHQAEKKEHGKAMTPATPSTQSKKPR